MKKLLLLSAVLLVVGMTAQTAHAVTGKCECSGTMSGLLVSESVCTSCDGLSGAILAACQKLTRSWDAATKKCNVSFNFDGEESACDISKVKIPTVTVSGACNFTVDAGGTAGVDPGGTSGVPPGGSTTPPPSGSTYELPNFLGITDPNILINRIIKAIIGITGTAALVVFIYGGFLWLTSMGDAGKVKEGTNAMKWATIGLVVIFSAYILVNFILTSLISSGGG